jgi:hypothetical protein
MLRRLFVLVSIFLSVSFVASAQQLQAISQPDRIHIFQNNIAFVKDTLSLPGGTEIELALPASALVDTLVLREDGERVRNYTVRRDSQITIAWQSNNTDTLREITAEYLIEGISWRPKYDMVINDDTSSAEFDFFAEIQNTSFSLEGVETFLVAGNVGTSQILGDNSAIAFNQLYAEAEFDDRSIGSTSIESVTIQHVYDIGNLSMGQMKPITHKLYRRNCPFAAYCFGTLPLMKQ